MNVLVFGATSAIAHAIDRRYAAGAGSFFLVGRDRAKLQANAQDLRDRGATNVATTEADLTKLELHDALVGQAIAALGRLDVVIIAHGVLPDQLALERDPEQLRATVETNLTSVLSLASASARQLASQRAGSLVVMGSVAGDRGKLSNYVYGAAKAGIAVFLDGLRARLRPQGVHVLTVKPGFVDTPMTARFKKGFLWATPDRVAAAVCAAIDRRRSVIYVPWFWRPVMLVIRALPRPLFERLGL